MKPELIFTPNKDRTECAVHLQEGERELLQQAAAHVKNLLTGVDEVGDTARLFPPAYGEDWARQVEYDRLKKNELSESHVAAIDTLLQLLTAKTANAEEIEDFMRAVNFIRLVVAKPLELTDETVDADFPPDHPRRDTWLIYLYMGDLQFQALQALASLNGELGGTSDVGDGEDYSSN